MIWTRRLPPALGALAATLILTASALAADVKGYLTPQEMPAISAWLPAQPAPGSSDEQADVERFLATRALLSGAEGRRANLDVAYAPVQVAPRFAEALGVELTPKNAPAFFRLMDRAMADLETLVAPVKLPLGQGGRVRPFVAHPGQGTCLPLYPGIENTGSYPSTHAALGWLWGALLAEMEPDRADRLIARGLEYGESRIICGFHYPSDVAAGRLAASVLIARLHADPEFRADFRKAKAEVDAARGLKRPPFDFRLPRLFPTRP